MDLDIAGRRKVVKADAPPCLDMVWYLGTEVLTG